ncbi:MAG: lipoyl synthase [Clostridiales bacterium]|jgi:lipoic acid synthetase|nr:lipoyl synthase [Clostridiales bacterium]
MNPKPAWLRKKLIADPNQQLVEDTLAGLRLNTVCREAGCPNSGECFARGTATFLILGDVCTRDCRFCAVRGGAPSAPDAEEPERVARAVAALGLRHAVVTSVTRDDLPDGGARFFAATVAAVRQTSPAARIELLIPDFAGDRAALAAVAAAGPDVIGHNMETVAALYADVRPQADYRRSLSLLSGLAGMNGGIRRKSGFMLGLGESRAQVLALMEDLRAAGCELLTIGQYLAPTRAHLPVVEYVRPDVFSEYGDIAKSMGFLGVQSAPFVRSSYRAESAFERL